jgi:3-isopropylmalate dehydratase small subunit
MFAGNLTYEINSTQAEKIVPYMLRDFDPGFSAGARKGDIIVCGENFGCGSSREHPAVGFVKIGIKAILVKSVSRIFYRSAINQGLPIFVVPEAVNAYHAGDKVEIAMQQGTVSVAGKQYSLPVLPAKLLDILERGGLVKALAKG